MVVESGLIATTVGQFFMQRVEDRGTEPRKVRGTLDIVIECTSQNGKMRPRLLRNLELVEGFSGTLLDLIN